MKVRNIHKRVYPVPSQQLGQLLDTLASDNDCIWPHEHWPAMKFKEDLVVGAVGGHKPIRYSVESFNKGRSVVFRFLSPRGFKGTHSYRLMPISENKCELIHTIEMDAQGKALVAWVLVIRPLHDALLKDSLSKVGVSIGLKATPNKWSVWVKLLRWVMSGGKPRVQKVL